MKLLKQIYHNPTCITRYDILRIADQYVWCHTTSDEDADNQFATSYFQLNHDEAVSMLDHWGVSEDTIASFTE